MAFFQRLSTMRELSYFVLTRGILLSCALLASALLVLVWAGDYSYRTDLLFTYASYMQTMALTTLGAGLIGAAFLEEVLVHTNPN